MIRCFYCDSKEGPFVKDHFLPKSLGGKDSARNRVDACYWCDKRKANMHPRVWLDVCPGFGRQRVHQKLVDMKILEGGMPPDYKPKITPKKRLPRDSKSVSDGPGSWYGQSVPSTLPGSRLDGMPPPSWSKWAKQPGPVKSLRYYAKNYIELLAQEQEAS